MNCLFTYKTSYSTNFLVITAGKNGLPVGAAKVVKRVDSWVLADIKVNNFRNTNPWRKMRSPGLFQNYRKQGVGSGLLKTLISEAKQAGISKISGEIIGEHPEMLKKWYSRFGFIVDSKGRIELKVKEQ